MSPFVVLEWKLQHERYGAGGAPTTNEPTRANEAGSNSTSQAQDTQTTPGSGAVIDLGAAGEAAVQSLPADWSCGVDFETTRAALKQSSARENHQQSTAVAADALA